jgi:F0F1-type ATP synthase membrane subunit b/b'
MALRQSLVERLRASGCALCSEAADVIEQMRRDAHETQMEFQREARDIAAEARWQAREEFEDRGW